ncbi:MAG: hypothetical protein JXQ71_00535 [Verrucomicrobia bacterium]|nr:hypothetical protein [Verrucomicrobiota bacterium]
MTEPPHLLYCHCAHARVVPPEVKTEVLRQLCASGASFEAVADLCALAARQDPLLRRLAAGGPLKIAACYPRAVRWLFAAGQAALSEARTEVLNMRVQPAPAVVAAMLDPRLHPNLAAMDNPKPGRDSHGTGPAPMTS